MNGIYGYDGYIYQTVVTLFLVLDAILDPERGLSHFYLEVNDENSLFSVDTVIVSAGQKMAEFNEIKGGWFSFENCQQKLNDATEYFVNNNLLEKKCETKIRVIYKDSNQISQSDIQKYGEFLKEVSNSLNIASVSSKPIFSGLEHDTMALCRSLVRGIIPNFDSESYKIRIYLAWRHFIEVQIQYLAEKLRNDPSPPPPEKITLEEFLKSDNLICDILAEAYHKEFANKSDVFEQITTGSEKPVYQEKDVNLLKEE